MPSRRDVLKAGGLATAGVLAGGAARYGAWSPAPLSAPAGTWLQPRYDYENTGHNPEATPPTDSPDVARMYDAPGEAFSLAAGVGNLYVGSEHSVAAFEYGSETPRWERTAGGRWLAVGSDVVVAAGEGEAAAFAATNGERLWRRNRDAYAYDVLVDRRTAYVGWNDALAAYDIGSGEPRWRLSASDAAFAGFDGGRLLVAESGLDAYEPRGALRGVLADGPRRAWASRGFYDADYPVVAGGYALVGSGGGPPGATSTVTAVTSGGDQEWRTELGNNAGNIASDGERAYAVSMRYGDSEGGVQYADTTTLHALSVDSGDEQWSFQRTGWFVAPVVADGTVFVGERGGPNGNGNLHALDAATGEHRWTDESTDGVNVLVAVGETLYAGTGRGVLAFE
ncbi:MULTISPECIES: PQQ-binding-like beta-propeller repeat protein [Halobacterium]|uniref:outer membrane protein assembly factor BamB family protein n=1 Tax=Halobacterium TaxID=2239 RepID=UPI0009E887F7|nr:MULTISPECIES: PQQ-binding-like beta-propeller repeat protein [Halobacterium]MCG1004522.1 PQQ-binding-like beta-propeller repeat protein [Halobacterium noricense]